MILIVGGAHSGKRNYVAAQLGYDLKQMSDKWDDAPVLYNLQDLLKETPKLELLMPLLCQKEIIICNEVGCGVVPINNDDEAGREMVGRACCMLASEADKVIRVQCGIGTVIKGE